jgi:hypothetical protein
MPSRAQLLQKIRNLKFDLEGSLEDIQISLEVMNEFPRDSPDWLEARSALLYHQRFAKSLVEQIKHLQHELYEGPKMKGGQKRRKR